MNTILNGKGLSRKAVSKVRQRLAEDTLYGFVKQAWPIVEPATPFVDGWHLQAICDHLEACTRGDIRKLIINIPPRHMKSLAVGVFWFCWSWIHNPSSRWMFSCYSHGLASRDSNKCRAVIESDWYQRNWGDRVRIRRDMNSKDRFENIRTGFRMSTGVLGGATGEGGDFIVCDDPHKASDVNSDTARNHVLNWWDNTMSTRLNDPKTGRHIVVMQRLHEMDLTGWLLDQNRGYELLCIPAEYDSKHPFTRTTSIGWSDPRTEDGEALWPERYGKPEIAELKTNLGTAYNISGQLQQNPAPSAGGMFDRSTFNYFKTEAVDMGDGETRDAFVFNDANGNQKRIWRDECWGMQTCDTAMKVKDESNYTVIMTTYVSPSGEIFIDDIARDRIPVPKQYNFLIAQRERHPDVLFQAVEDHASGIGLIQEGRAKGTPFKKLRADGDKVRRSMIIATAYENGAVFHKSAAQAPWLEEYENELMFFPNGKHDDQVDCVSYAGMLALRNSMTAIMNPLIMNSTSAVSNADLVRSEEDRLKTGTERMQDYISSQQARRRATDEDW